MSAVLLARLITRVTAALTPELALKTPICYTNSQISYYWIHGLDKGWRPFVQNRVDEIRKLVPSINWRHCPGSEDPADIPSCGLSLAELVDSDMWLHGPSWLTSRGSHSEEDDPPKEIPEECWLEHKVSVVPTLLTTESHGISNLIEIVNYSDIDRLLQVTAYTQLFLLRLKGLTASLCQLMVKSETLWVIEAQKPIQSHRLFETKKKQLNLFLDALGVWRCGGRLHNAELDYSAKFPVLLMSGHFTILVIQRAHLCVFHGEVKATLTELRANYWVLKSRRLVKQIVSQCRVCHRLDALSYSVPPPPPLPPFRVREAPPFASTGVDFVGPFYIKLTKSKATEKAWICLFTCCAVRAIHLELVLDMSTQSFLQCFKHFAVRRGLPKRMVSDNSATFKSAAKFLKNIMSDENVNKQLAERRVEWVFNIERAPWWGGLFERMVQATKRCLRR